MRNFNTIFLLIFLFFLSCTSKTENDNNEAEKSEQNEKKIDTFDFNKLTYSEKLEFVKKNLSNDSFLANDTAFINEKILKGKFRVDITYCDTIKRDYCLPERLNKQNTIKDFEGFNNIGDIDNDKQDDYVFVLPAINICEEGQSYYFSNPTIPRIYTESNCCHPQSVFSIGDIDEDGRNEIAQYYSSCASRFKTITIWTLKNNKWNEVETFFYVINEEYKVFDDFNKLSKKISKNKFKFLEISDINRKGELIKEWKTISMK